MVHYTSFHEKSSSPLVTIHAGPVYVSKALSANIISVIDDYYLPKIEDITFSTPTIPKKGIQKSTRKKLRTKINILHLQ